MIDQLEIDSEWILKCLAEHEKETGEKPTRIFIPEPSMRIHGIPLRFHQSSITITHDKDIAMHHERKPRG